MHYGLPLGSIFMPDWNLEYAKVVTLHFSKVVGGMAQGPATEATNLRVNQPPVFLVY